MKPTLGRMVHYTVLSYEAFSIYDEAPNNPRLATYAAIIVGVKPNPLESESDSESDYELLLKVLYPFPVNPDEHEDLVAGVIFSENYEDGTWTWPPRV